MASPGQPAAAGAADVAVPATLSALPIEIWLRVFAYFLPGTVFTVFRVVCRSWHDAAVAHLSAPKNAVTVRASRVRAYWAKHPRKGSWAACLAPMTRAAVKFDLPVVLPENCPAASLAGLLAAPVAIQVNHVAVAWRSKRMPQIDHLPSGFTGFPAAIANHVLRGLGLGRHGASLAVKLRIPAPASDTAGDSDGDGGRELRDGMAVERDEDALPRGNASAGPAKACAPPACSSTGKHTRPVAGRRSPNQWVSSAAFWEHVATLHISFWCPAKVVRRHPYPTIDVAHTPPLSGLVSLSTSLNCPVGALLPLCPRLETLKVTRNRRLTDLNVLLDKTVCPALRSVHIEACWNFVCLDGFQHRPKLTELELSPGSILSVAPLLNLPELVSLCIDSTKIIDKALVLCFPRLRHLTLTGIYFIESDYKLSETLRNCPALKHLHFCGICGQGGELVSLGTGVGDHAQLEEVTTGIEELVQWVEAACLEDPDFETKRLPRLRLANRLADSAQDRSLLARLPVVVQRRVIPHDTDYQSMNIRDLSQLSPTWGINRLRLSNYSFGTTSGLLSPLVHFSRATSITSIVLNYDRIADYGPLAACTSLEALDIDRSVCAEPGIQWLATLRETLPRLVNLTLSDKQLVDITPLADCGRLRTLSLRSCASLTDLMPLRKCSQLLSLELSEMAKLQFVDALSSCHDLRVLLLDETGVCDLTPLAACRSLRLLTLEEMKHICLKHLSPLTQCSSLEWLNLGGTGVLHSEFQDWLRSSQRPASLLHAVLGIRWSLSKFYGKRSVYFLES